ncbi:MAG: undecaprenyldiphospho-muramoylpentapeptide beta-N-acetylglucosaminyltransferase [Bacteroidota bacterium]
MQSKRFRILFAGGGTGGHLFPGIAIADEIKKIRPDAEITFVGTRNKIEARVVPQRGYAFAPIWISGFRRRLSADNLLFPLKTIVALMQSFILILKIRPAVVVGTGGYVCGPVIFAASLLGIPTLIQEQNSYPGVTTRLLAGWATEVHVTFESSLRYLKRTDNVKVTGNPTRATLGTVTRLESAKFFNVDPQKPTLLVFGGSLGARSINDAILAIVDKVAGDHVQMIWQTGESDFDRVKQRLGDGYPDVRLYKFIDQMQHAYAVCDLIVSRAGATSVAEIARAGVPSILVPYPHAAADHQTENARAMVEFGASVMIKDDELATRLPGTIQELLGNPERRNGMAEKAKAMGKPGAAPALAQAVITLATTS